MGNIYRCKSLYAQNITEIEILELRHDFYMKLKLCSSTLWLPNISSYSDLDQKIQCDLSPGASHGKIWDSALGTRNSCNVIQNNYYLFVLWQLGLRCGPCATVWYNGLNSQRTWQYRNYQFGLFMSPYGCSRNHKSRWRACGLSSCAIPPANQSL